jgi:hypothetical protein
LYGIKKREGVTGKKLKRQDYVTKDKTENFLSIGPFKMETML